jgi:cellulose biosynthesis protein BcsQ
MKIAIFNKKGGVGKTPISFLLAKELGYHILTNDDNVISKEMVTYQDKIDMHGYDNIVIDMGGWIDDNTLDILQECDIVLIPFNSKPNSIKRTKNLMNELDTFGIGYNLIFTQYTSEREIDYIKEEIGEVDYLLHNTKMLDIMIKENLTIKECLDNSTYNNWFKNHAVAMQQLVDDLKKAS